MAMHVCAPFVNGLAKKAKAAPDYSVPLPSFRGLSIEPQKFNLTPVMIW
jgi:hypothetical protein